MGDRKRIKLLDLNSESTFEFTFDDIHAMSSDGVYTYITFVSGYKAKYYYKDFMKCLGKERKWR